MHSLWIAIFIRTPFLFHSCAFQVPENDFILSAHIRLNYCWLYMARGIVTLLASWCEDEQHRGLQSPSFELPLQLGHKQGSCFSIKTGNHTFWNYDTKGVLLFTAFIPPPPSFLFSDVCLLYMQDDVCMSPGSQLKPSPWLGCTQ